MRNHTLSTSPFPGTCHSRSKQSKFRSCSRFALPCTPCVLTPGGRPGQEILMLSCWDYLHQVQPKLRAAAPKQHGASTGSGAAEDASLTQAAGPGATQPPGTSGHTSASADVKGSGGGGKTWFSHLLPSSNPLRRLRRAPSPPSPADALGVSSPYSGLCSPVPVSSAQQQQHVAIDMRTRKRASLPYANRTRRGERNLKASSVPWL